MTYREYKVPFYFGINHLEVGYVMLTTLTEKTAVEITKVMVEPTGGYVPEDAIIESRCAEVH